MLLTGMCTYTWLHVSLTPNRTHMRSAGAASLAFYRCMRGQRALLRTVQLVANGMDGADDVLS